MSFSINKLLGVILVIVVVGIVLMFLFKVDITKYFEFLPDFDSNKEDKVVNLPTGSEEGEKQTDFLRKGENCCCLYEKNVRTKNCKVVELEMNEYCNDKLDATSEENWVNSDVKYCEK
ncbi:hypothetical protein CMI44_00450 [Candidatus Pacearchaeota archaeon]|jgi:hypothetical protein|nr:hypothetical protein [Candidatus Pacearchaeota archaeon]|tara:strand:+ start:1092 stop:1445 length:354 start_codon:yes stop_codon:yes gene_type:complete